MLDKFKKSLQLFNGTFTLKAGSWSVRADTQDMLSNHVTNQLFFPQLNREVDLEKQALIAWEKEKKRQKVFDPSLAFKRNHCSKQKRFKCPFKHFTR